MKPILQCDVDQTVVDTLRPWIKWYNDLTGHELTDDCLSKNKTLEEVMHKHETPLDYWKISTLYDKLKPIPEAVEVLHKLTDKYQIVFVSNCFPEHEKSKRMFLRRSFKFNFGFISTADKHFVKSKVMIDDYGKYLRNMKLQDPNCICIKIITSENSLDPNFYYLDWNGIYNLLEREL